MLSSPFILWDVGYPVYTYGSLFIIAIIIWQMKRRHQGLRLGPNKSCDKCYRRIKPTPRDRALKVKRTSKEEAEKLQKLLSVMKSQGWLPQEGSVRRLLCSDSSCPICNSMALEVQQLLGCENKMTSPTPLRPSKSFTGLEALSASKEPSDKSPKLCSQHSRDISMASSLTPSQSTDQKSSTQSAAPSTGDTNILYYCPDHQPKQESQESNVCQDVGSLSSSSAEEPRVPANQKKKKKSKKLVLKDQATPEAEAENKMTFFSHWVNPEVKYEKLEEPIVQSNCEAKPKTKESKKSQTPVRDHEERVSMEQTTEDPNASPLGAKNI